MATMSYEDTIRNDMRMEDDETDFIVYHRVYGSSVGVTPDGEDLIQFSVETNDDDDDGYADGEITKWADVCTRDQFHRIHGVCRVGVSGVIVTVSLDGEEVR
jgi:hypothetical protein